MNTSEKPEWLEDNGESSGGVADEAIDPFDNDNDNDNADQNNNNNKGSSRFTCSSKTIVFSLISLVFVALFAYSASTQSNDADGIEWIVFYSLNAAIPALFLVYYTCTFTCCFPIVVVTIYAVSVLTCVWSIVYIVIAALKVGDTPAGGDTSETGDNDGQTLRQEYIFELAGASIALFSSLYHVVMARFCVSKERPVKVVEHAS